MPRVVSLCISTIVASAVLLIAFIFDHFLIGKVPGYAEQLRRRVVLLSRKYGHTGHTVSPPLLGETRRTHYRSSE